MKLSTNYKGGGGLKQLENMKVKLSQIVQTGRGSPVDKNHSPVNFIILYPY